jgi:UDPglucose 6-dehydrogenase
MNITIIGTGYVGLVTGTCLADLGNSVCCLDIDPAKIATLNSGGVPIHEPGLGALIQSNVEAGRLRFTTDVADAVAFGDVQFIAVGTPPDEDGSADLQYVLAAARNIGRHMTGFKVVVDKSTVPVGTADKVRAAIQAELGARGVSEHTGFSVVSNPEFLKEGAAVDDFMRPDRIVLGVDATTPEGQRALALMRQLYLPFNRNHERTRVMDVKSAEFTKYAANAMLATRISFMNELANLADKVGADIELVRQGIGSDPRIGYSFLYAGTGYGGSCFPKDVQALVRTAGEHGQRLRVLEAVEAVNHEQKHIIVNKILARYGQDLSGRHFALWGLAFKPNTDDMRDAPSRVLIQALLRAGASIHAHDPVAAAEARRVVALDLMRILITGGAGFLGSHLCDLLVERGHDVLCVDNFFTGRKENIAHLLRHPRFELMRHDVTFPLYVEVDQIYNLACPASPRHYQHDPVQTTKVSVHGAINLLGLAKRLQAPSCRRPPARCTATPRCTRRPRTTGAGSIRSASGPATTKASAAPRPCSSTTGASTGCASRWPASSTPTARACTPTTGAWCRTSSCRPCRARTSRSTGTAARRAASATTSATPANSPSASWLSSSSNSPAAPRSSSSNPCPPTTPCSASPTSPWPATHLGWEPTVPLREGLVHTIAYFDQLLTTGPAGLHADN